MTAFVTFFDGFMANKNGNLHLFWWLCCEEGDDSNLVAFFYDGGANVKKVMVIDDFLFLFFCPYGLVH